MNKIQPFKVGYGDIHITFFLKMLTQAEEESIYQRLNEISDTDEERFNKQFEIHKDALVKGVDKMPLIDKAGKEGPLAKDGTPGDAILEHFRAPTEEKRRLARAAWILFRSKLEPDAVFL